MRPSRRIRSVVGALVVGGALWGALVSSTYGAEAARTPATHARQHISPGIGSVPPVPHPYGPNGMRMGLHCETTDTS